MICCTRWRACKGKCCGYSSRCGEWVVVGELEVELSWGSGWNWMHLGSLAGGVGGLQADEMVKIQIEGKENLDAA